MKAEEGGWETFAPSVLAFNPGEEPPQQLDRDGINKVINDFKQAAGRALQVGYKLMEIHAAHGYLIHQFLSPLSNTRTDEYGGSFENRVRLLLEIVKAIQTEWPENLPLLVRISATDWADGGWNLQEAIRLCTLLKTEGVDLIDCSSGGLVPYARIPLAPGYQVPFAEQIKKETGLLTSAVGLITEVQQAEEIIANGQADLVLIGRASLREPYFALHSAKKSGAGIDWPLQYLRAKL